MTDIARPCNPALSFSSFNDDNVAYRTSMATYPDRIEILSPSPRTTIQDLEATDDDGRSKSAPPDASRSQLELNVIEEVVALSSTYDPRRLVRPDSAPPCRSPNGRQTVIEKNRTRNPEIGVLPLLRTQNAGATNTAGVISSARNDTAEEEEDGFENPSNNNNTLLVSTDFLVGERTDAAEDNIDNSCLYRSSFSQFQEEEQHRTTTIDGRQLSRPIPHTPSRLSTILVPPTPEANEHRGGGGTLILRPNPIKAAEIITTTNLSPAELVRAAATATSEQPQVVELQQHCANEETTTKTTTPHEKASQRPETTATTTNNTTTTAATGEKKINEGFNTAQARQAEKEAQRMLKEAQQQRKQEFQVNFPEDTNATFAMPYSSSHEEKLSGNNHSHSRNEGARIRHSTQQSHQQHRDRMSGMRASSGAESFGNRNNNNRSSEDMHPEAARAVQPTPLFERLVTEEVQELKTYAGIVERQNVELAKQKKVQEDLEARLRAETRRRKELESLLEEQERLWSEKFVELEQERNTAEKMLQDEQTKTKKLINQVQRKDRDIHDFFKKKYDHDGGRSLRSSIRGGVGPAAERNQQSSTASTSRLAEFPQQSPQQLLNDLGSDEKVREGNAKNLLLDFFGI